MAKALGTLSPIGWASSVDDKLDNALSNFFCAEETQTYLFPGKIADVHTAIYEGGHDMERVQTQLVDGLQNFLRNVFDDANVNSLDVSKALDEKSNRVKILLSIYIRDRDISRNVKKIAEFDNKFQKIVDANNG